MESGNIFELIPQTIDSEIFEHIITHEHVTIERILSKGQSSPATGWYQQEKNEWVIVLKGEAIIAYENDEVIHLNPGQYVNIPANTRHKVQWTHPQMETVWVAVHY